MRTLFLSGIFVLCSSGTMAQGVLLSETFESTGGTAPPPGWSWIGSPPVYVGGSGSNYGISKESEDLSVPPPPSGSTSLLFHPLSYNATWSYHVFGDLCVGGAGAGTAAAGAILCWVNLGTGQFAASGNSITSFSPFPIYQFQSSVIGTAPGNSLGPNAQFGIMLVCGIGDGNAYAAFDNINVNASVPTVSVQPRLWLDGAYDQGTGLMRDDLRTAGLIPLTEPYSALMGGTGGETVAPSVLAVTGNDAIVDWVRVELRASPTGASTLVRHALLQRDGDVVAVDGISQVVFTASPGQYHVLVRHRNHLAVMTATTRSLSTAPFPIDFRSAATVCYMLPAPTADEPRRTRGNTRTLWAGDVSRNGIVSYTGTGNDRDLILQAIGGVTPTSTITGQYRIEDVNLDGTVKYTGTNNDRDAILQTVGGVVPSNLRNGQVP